MAIDYKSLQRLAMACRSPHTLVTLTRLLYQYDKSHPDGGERIAESLFEMCDDSPFGLSDWLDAIEHFYNWLQLHSRVIDFAAMLKYMQCCIAAPDAKEPGQTFAGLITDMLEVCGYEGSDGPPPANK